MMRFASETRLGVLAVVTASLLTFPASVVTAKHTEPRQIVIDDDPKYPGECIHDGPGLLPVTLSKKDKDEIEWELANFCHLKQPVLVCVYPRPQQQKKPFACSGKAKIEKVFSLKPGEAATMNCWATGDADVTGYRKQVLVGEDVTSLPSSKCPDQPIGPHQHHGHTNSPATHILDIDVQP